MNTFATRILAAPAGLEEVIKALDGDERDVREIQGELGGNAVREFNRTFSQMSPLSQGNFITMLQRYLDGERVERAFRNMCEDQGIDWRVVKAFDDTF